MFYFGQFFNLNTLCGFCFAPIRSVELADEYLSEEDTEDEGGAPTGMNQFSFKDKKSTAEKTETIGC